MNGKLFFKLLLVVLVLEGIHMFANPKYWWEIFSLKLPQFCTTFSNRSGDCMLDYSESSESFLKRYEQFCQANFFPGRNKEDSSKPLCRCIPENLQSANQSTPSYETIDGLNSPRDCAARHKTAIIIPYRNREKHLNILLKSLHSLLQQQNLAYQIFIIEQNKPVVFNKAVLMNAGFLEVNKEVSKFDCFIFHDVDMIPLDNRNFYTCLSIPRHVGAFIQIFNFKLSYQGIFGGVTAFNKNQFESLNGFSNNYYGWGGEDDDMLQRVNARNMMVNRFPISVSKYSMITHRGDPGNPGNVDRYNGFSSDPMRYSRDGLNSVNYTLEKVERKERFVWMQISIPEPPTTFKKFERSHIHPLLDADPFFHWFAVFTLVTFLAILVILRSNI